ncbi:pterin binding enzyme family protein [Mycobacterium kansasii 732]|nr:pterin binding enzyme family protein [Mycobacterium kansasii 732]
MHAMLCGRPVAADRPLIMAIVNRTPDSFYDKGATFSDGAAREAVHRAIDEGADVIDVGGVKAGPGEDVDADTEIARLLPFVEWLRGAYPNKLISVDTWRAEVARLACAAGADLINDTWGGIDPAIPGVAAEFGAGLVCAHTGERCRAPDRFGSATVRPPAAWSTTSSVRSPRRPSAQSQRE